MSAKMKYNFGVSVLGLSVSLFELLLQPDETLFEGREHSGLRVT